MQCLFLELCAFKDTKISEILFISPITIESQTILILGCMLYQNLLFVDLCSLAKTASWFGLSFSRYWAASFNKTTGGKQGFKTTFLAKKWKKFFLQIMHKFYSNFQAGSNGDCIFSLEHLFLKIYLFKVHFN